MMKLKIEKLWQLCQHEFNEQFIRFFINREVQICENECSALHGALTDRIDDQELFIKEIDDSYYYEKEE